jgi:hypothetical protein
MPGLFGTSHESQQIVLTEGRRALLRRVSGIERGAECARYEPILSATDGAGPAPDPRRLPELRV